MSQQQRQQENQMNANINNANNPTPEVLEQGDIYFFYRPKKMRMR